MELNVSRRNWLRFLGGSAVAASTLTQVKQAYAAQPQAVAPRESWAYDDGYWEKVRKQFMLEDGLRLSQHRHAGPDAASGV